MFSCSVVSDSFVTLWTVSSLPGSSVHVISYSRILEWVATFFSRGSSRPRGIELISLMSPALEGGFFTTEPPGKPGDPLQGFKKSHLNKQSKTKIWKICFFIVLVLEPLISGLHVICEIKMIPLSL